MTISRQNVAAYLDEQFSALAVSVRQATAPLFGYAPDIDGALRKLATAEADLATATVVDSLRDAIFALSEYYAARRIWRLLGDRVDNSTGLNSYKFDGQRKQAKEIMDNAANSCAALGYSVDGRVLRTATFRVY